MYIHSNENSDNVVLVGTREEFKMVTRALALLESKDNSLIEESFMALWTIRQRLREGFEISKSFELQFEGN